MTVSRIVAALFAGSLALIAISPAQAGFESFMKMKGVDGAVTDDMPAPPPAKVTAPPSAQPSTPVVRNFVITRKLVVAPGPAKLRAK